MCCLTLGRRGGVLRWCWLLTGLCPASAQRLGFLLSATLATKAVQDATLATEGINNIHAAEQTGVRQRRSGKMAVARHERVRGASLRGDGLAARMLSVDHGVTNHILEEDLSGGDLIVRREWGQGGGA